MAPFFLRAVPYRYCLLPGAHRLTKVLRWGNDPQLHFWGICMSCGLIFVIGSFSLTSTVGSGNVNSSRIPLGSRQFSSSPSHGGYPASSWWLESITLLYFCFSVQWQKNSAQGQRSVCTFIRWNRRVSSGSVFPRELMQGSQLPGWERKFRGWIVRCNNERSQSKYIPFPVTSFLTVRKEVPHNTDWVCLKAYGAPCNTDVRPFRMLPRSRHHHCL